MLGVRSPTLLSKYCLSKHKQIVSIILVRLITNLLVCLFIHLLVCLSISLRICLFINSFVCLFIYSFINLFVSCATMPQCHYATCLEECLYIFLSLLMGVESSHYFPPAFLKHDIPNPYRVKERSQLLRHL